MVGFRFVRGVGAFVARACVNVDIATAVVRVFCGVGVRDFNRARASSCSRPVASSPPCQTCALLCVVAGAAAKRCFSRVRLFGIAWKVVGYKVEPPLVCGKSVNLERYWPGYYTPPKFLFFLVCFAEPCLHSHMKKLKMLLLFCVCQQIMACFSVSSLLAGPACLLPSHASWDVAAVAGLLSLVMSCRTCIVVVYTHPTYQTKIRRVRHVSNLCACLHV